MAPLPQADIHHDRTLHSFHVDEAWDLNVLPWPWAFAEFDEIYAIDVFEHLNLDPWWKWLDECWRILKWDGLLVARLPAWDNPLSFRDPTHTMRCLPFHQDRFAYWDPCHPLWRDFGRLYPFADVKRWWHVQLVARDSNDWRFFLRKVGEDHGADAVADGERSA